MSHAIVREKCRAGMMLENARAIVIEFFSDDEPAAIQDATRILDRLAGEIRAEVAAELGENYERVWNECEDLDFFSPGHQLDIPIGWEFSTINPRTWRRPIEVVIWTDPQISQFLKDAAMYLGLDYERNAFIPRDDRYRAAGDHDAARILDYFAWLHYWIQDADTLAAPMVFKVLQSELERLAGEDCSENDEEIPQ